MVVTAKIRGSLKTVILVLIMLGLSFPEQVAQRCKGEFSASVAECACTVKNRLDVGWARSKVLSAYYAPDKKVTADEIYTVEDVLNEQTFCNSRYYFMYSLADTKNLGIDQVKPELIVRSGNSEIRFFGRWFRRSK
jgi:hypothetical protein